ncbi:MAG: NAD(+) synthase [Treponema sp.]|jgi:NAD+ synthase|nr:NAD(+) synthase [Treponema sp.]
MFDALKVTENIIQWIRDYFADNGKDCTAVIGISGGKDSSIVAALCVKALGADRVFGVLMPQGEQHDISWSHEITARLGIKSITINIKETVDALLSSINTTGLCANNQAVTNIPARIRMTALYAVSAILNGRVANTCNVSEDWIGYSTKYGDMAGDFSPLAKLTVTEIKAIGRELGLPSKFIDKVPEDGLSGLTDEQNIGISYDVIDKYIREGACENTAIKEKIDKLHRANAHKLSPMPCFTPDN